MLVASSNFLIPNGTFIAELLIFLIVLGVMAKFVLPPLRDAVDARAQGLRDEVQAAEAARAEAEQLNADRRRTLSEARAEARGIVDGAAREAEQARDDARNRGQAEYERLMTDAKASIDVERARARAEISSDLPGLVVSAAERVLGSTVDRSRHEAVIAAAISAASGAGAGDGTEGR